MGYGGWNRDTYSQTVSNNRAAGRDTFEYGRTARKVHKLLDPKRVASNRSEFAEQVMRACMITDEHPMPTPIVIGLDVTASNKEACYASFGKLDKLFGTLQRGVTDPEIMIAAVGDANSDQFPLQVGDFESDNRVDDQLQAMILEMGGGGQHHETYELLAYFLVKHTYLQPFYKQDRKAYVFFIGDEMPYPTVEASHVKRVIGDTTEDIPVQEVFETLKEQYNVYFLFQAMGGHTAEDEYGMGALRGAVMPTWRELLGENALVLDDPTNVCEVIASIVTMNETGMSWDQVSKDLSDAGFDPVSIDATARMLRLP